MYNLSYKRNIETKVFTRIFLILFLMVVLPAEIYSCQNMNLDSLGRNIQKNNMVHGGLGVQKSFFTELGFARHISSMDSNGAVALVYYTAVEFMPKTSADKLNLYGIKVGFEYSTTSGFGSLGLELKTISDFGKSDFMVTPRVGISMLGYFSLSYGYNFQAKKTFSQIGQHQFGLAFNLNKRVFREMRRS